MEIGDTCSNDLETMLKCSVNSDTVWKFISDSKTYKYIITPKDKYMPKFDGNEKKCN